MDVQIEHIHALLRDRELTRSTMHTESDVDEILLSLKDLSTKQLPNQLVATYLKMIKRDLQDSKPEPSLNYLRHFKICKALSDGSWKCFQESAQEYADDQLSEENIVGDTLFELIFRVDVTLFFEFNKTNKEAEKRHREITNTAKLLKNLLADEGLYIPEYPINREIECYEDISYFQTTREFFGILSLYDTKESTSPKNKAKKKQTKALSPNL